MSLVPNIFGKEDRYVGLLPLSFWIYYSFISKYSVFSILQILIGIFLLIPQIDRNLFDQKIREGKIKNTKDFSDFIRENSLLMIAGVLIYPYYIGTIIFGFFIKKDITLSFLLIVNIVGAAYWILTFILRSDFRQKIIEIKDFLMKPKK